MKKIILLLLFVSTFSFAQVGIGTTNPTAKLEIDAATDAIPALEIVPRTTAPTGTASGQMSIIDGSLYIYDATRSKWLSSETIALAFGRDGNANNRYLDFASIGDTNLTGAKMPYNGTIVAVTTEAAGGLSTKGFEIHRNLSTTSLFSYNLTSWTYNNTTTSIDFNAGDYLHVFAVQNPGSPVNSPTAILYIKWRK